MNAMCSFGTETTLAAMEQARSEVLYLHCASNLLRASLWALLGLKITHTAMQEPRRS
jgi:hypothetical protein